HLDGLAPETLEPLFKKRKIEGCVFASVVPRASKQLISSLKKLCPKIPVKQLNWETVSHILPNAITVKGMTPGADRAANAYALYRGGKFPAISIDAGTALTTEILDKSGTFIGGVIIPGARLQWQSLSEKTAQLKGLEYPDSTDGLFGGNSESAMRNGIGSVLILGLIDLIKKTEKEVLGAKFKRIVFTGGGAELYHEAVKKSFPKAELDPDFTLKALNSFFLDEKRQ
ncbi:type III pantothenate kinase, partial [bacterium]|nr:type III pantothenate kinase [bacterium]